MDRPTEAAGVGVPAPSPRAAGRQVVPNRLDADHLVTDRNPVAHGVVAGMGRPNGLRRSAQLTARRPQPPAA